MLLCCNCRKKIDNSEPLRYSVTPCEKCRVVNNAKKQIDAEKILEVTRILQL